MSKSNKYVIITNWRIQNPNPTHKAKQGILCYVKNENESFKSSEKNKEKRMGQTAQTLVSNLRS